MKCFFLDNGFAIEPSGKVTPCCRFHKNSTIDSNIIESINDVADLEFTKDSKLFNEVRNTLEQEIWHDGCIRCERDEEINNPSRRNIYNKLNYTRVIDVSLGNTCNLKCLMCRSMFSTQWNSDEQFLHNNNFILDAMLPPSSVDNEDIDKIVKYISKVEDDGMIEIELKGGEPLSMPSTKYIFEKLISLKKPNIQISITTNGTFCPDWFIEGCEHIPVLLNISIDGMNEVYDYIRGNEKYSYEYFHNNVKKIKQRVNLKRLHYNLVVQNTNIHQLADIINQYNTVNPIFLNYPLFLQLWNMPNESKNKILDSLQTIPKDIMFYHKITPLIENLMTSCNDTDYKEFITYVALLDFKRNKNLPKIMPHLFTDEALTLYNKIKENAKL